MGVEQYVRKYLKRVIKDFKKEITRTEKSLGSLDKIGENDLNYVVYIKSLWEKEGEASTITKHKGSLKEAIEKAESEFKSKNHRSDVQANLEVMIYLGKNEYPLPGEYWKKFRERYRE